MDYNEITKLFGQPLGSVPKPHVPFKLKVWHLAIGSIILGLTVYGAVKVFESINNENDKK
jgi:hypothetical protein